MHSTDNTADIRPLSSRERLLVALYLGQKPADGEIESLMDQVDIEQGNQAELLMLSCIGCRQGWKQFPEKYIPRLKGLHQYYQVHNTIRIPWLLEKIRALRGAGIPVLLLKGLSLRYYYAPGNPRVMGDYDIAVPEDRYDEAIRLLQGNGDLYLGDAPWLYHGVIQGKERTLEIHRWIFKHHGEKDTDIWERALPCDFFGEDVLVLCPEDMLLHQMDNRSRDLFENMSRSRALIFLCDCFRIVQKAQRSGDAGRVAADVAGLSARAGELHVANSFHRMLPFLADCFPEQFFLDKTYYMFIQCWEYKRWLEAGRKLQRATEKWQSYHYRPGGVMTPRRLTHAFARHYALARMKAVEMEEMNCKYHFWNYCGELCRSGAVRILLRRYRTQPCTGKSDGRKHEGRA